MKLSLFAILVTFSSIVIIDARPNRNHGPGDTHLPHGWDEWDHGGGNDYGHFADATPVRGETHQGTPSNPSTIRGEPDEEGEGPEIPNANPSGPFTPSGPSVNL